MRGSIVFSVTAVASVVVAGILLANCGHDGSARAAAQTLCSGPIERVALDTTPEVTHLAVGAHANGLAVVGRGHHRVPSHAHAAVDVHVAPPSEVPFEMPMDDVAVEPVAPSVEPASPPTVAVTESPVAVEAAPSPAVIPSAVPESPVVSVPLPSPPTVAVPSAFALAPPVNPIALFANALGGSTHRATPVRAARF